MPVVRHTLCDGLSATAGLSSSAGSTVGQRQTPLVVALAPNIFGLLGHGFRVKHPNAGKTVRIGLLQRLAVVLLEERARDVNFVRPTEHKEGGQACPVSVALDIVAEMTNIVVSSPHSLWFRSCGVAGQSFTRALVKEFNLSLAQAEQRKRAPELTERLSDVCETLSPPFDDLVGEVRQSLIAYAQTWPDHPVQRVFGFGGGVMLHGLFRHLRCGR